MLIQGSGGGGGGGGGSQSSDPPSLRSQSLINFVFLLSEGEIAGFPAGEDIRKFIYANNTPVMNPDGTFNFLGVTADWRPGTQSQSVMPSTYPGAENPVSVNQQIFNSYGSVVRSITNTLCTSIRVTLFCPSLQEQRSDGSIGNFYVAFRIYLSSGGGAFVQKVYDIFNGRTASGYARDYTIDVSGLAPPYKIGVERVTPDTPPSDTQRQNSLYWQSYTTILQQQFAYPNSALLYVSFDTTYFNGQPNVSILLRGLICTIPSNYNPVTRSYTGIWDGTWTRAFTNNPAWCLLMLLTNPIYGCGQYISLAQIDKWSLYTIARYCDEMVTDGLGGMEPRYQYNHYMTARAEAFTQIKTILSQIRGIAYYAGGQIYFAIDTPNQQPLAVFNDSNTVREYDEDGRLTQPAFTYDYVSLKQKQAIANISWYDQIQFGKKRVEYLDLYDIGYGDDFDRYGAEAISVDLVGCTSQAEARRHGRWLLATGRLESKTVLFATGDEGRVRKPSELIEVFDAHEQGARYGGRIVDATNTQIVLDSQVTIAGGDTFVVMIGNEEHTRSVANAAGVYDQITLTTPLPIAPVAGSVWGIKSAVQSEIYRVISVGNPSPEKYTIAAIASNPIKYALADGSESLLPITAQPPPNPPTNLIVQSVPGGYQVGWMASTTSNVVGYLLEYVEQGGTSWSPIVTTPGATSTSVSLPVGVYLFRVRARNINGQYSQFLESQPAYATSGTIAANSINGTAILDRSVNLVAGQTYYLQTTCSDRPGQATGISPYIDRRKIVNPPGVANELIVSPDYRGQRFDLTTQSTGISPDFAFTYLVVSGGNLTVTSGGLPTVTPPGSYTLTPTQVNAILAATAFTVTGTAVLWQYAPSGNNPALGGAWSINTTPLDQIGDITVGGGEILTI